MPDMSAISAGISSVKLAIDILKELKIATNSLKDAEIKLKIAELLEAITEVKLKLVEAQDENIELRETIKKLEHSLSEKEKVIFRDGYYFLAEPQEGKPEGPFCTNCYTTKNMLSLLTEVKGPFRRFGKYECPSCEKHFGQ